MPPYTTAEIRNIALVGHAGAGKTSLLEAMLKEAGVVGQIGLVENSDTFSDFTDEEKQHGQSLFNTVVHCEHDGRHLNIIDTPGAPDFVGQAISVLEAVETVAIVINASAGIEPATRRMMERAKKAGLCRMIIVNKIDADHTDLLALLEQINESFGRECLPINLPADGASRIVDCFSGTDGESDLGSVADAHTQIVDQVVEVDDALMETYLEQGAVKPEELHQAFSKALREGHLVPICFASGRKHDDPQVSVGIKELLNVFVQHAPSPAEGNPCSFKRGDGDDVHVAEPDAGKEPLAHVFKIVNDRFGKLSILRVHQGTIGKDTALFLHDSKRPLKISHLFRVHGDEHEEMEAAIPGDLCALIKVDELKLGSVVTGTQDNGEVRLQDSGIPMPMFGLAVTPKSRGDEVKIGEALSRLSEEDATFRVTRDSSTHETIVNGMGDMHLRIVLERLKSKYNIDVDTKPPTISYRETITIKAEGHHRHKKQTGGAGQFGEVYLRVEPMGRDEGFEFVNDIFGGSIPTQFIPAIEKGVRRVLLEGCVAGHPMQDIRVSVHDGKHHPVDSKEVAFVAAGRRAFQDAVSKAKPVLLEPIVTVQITMPSANMGDITGDLSGKRGRVQGTDMMPGDMTVVTALVPLSEMTNYQGQLKSVTGGQGSFSMELSHYDPVPGNVQQQIVARYKPKGEEE
jgi:elongation factor G